MIATEADAIHTARTGASLAELMLARGAQLPTVAPRTVEQAVTKDQQAAEVVAEAEQITADASVITCTHAACLNALHDECECACGGIGHGAATHVRKSNARARYTAKVDRLHGGNIFATVPTGDVDPIVHRVPGLAAIKWDADGWPID